MVLDRVNKRFPDATTAGVSMRSKRIQAGLSTQIIIQVESDTDAGKKFTIGGIQQLTYNQNRPLVRIKEVGTDGVIGIVPQDATTHDLQVQRMVFDFQRLPQSLQREYRHIHAQRRPFNIVVTDYNPYLGAGADSTGGTVATDTNATGGGGTLSQPDDTGNIDLSGHKVETVFVNCWFQSMNFQYSASDYLINESATLWCEHVHDVQATATIQGEVDSLERSSNSRKNSAVLSAFDSTRES